MDFDSRCYKFEKKRDSSSASGMLSGKWIRWWDIVFTAGLVFNVRRRWRATVALLSSVDGRLYRAQLWTHSGTALNFWKLSVSFIDLHLFLCCWKTIPKALFRSGKYCQIVLEISFEWCLDEPRRKKCQFRAIISLEDLLSCVREIIIHRLFSWCSLAKTEKLHQIQISIVIQ